MSEESQYNWSRTGAGGWRIGFGPSNFLVAEGSGWSLVAGERFFETLKDDPVWQEWWNGKNRAIQLQRSVA